MFLVHLIKLEGKMGENYFFEITKYYSYFVVMGSDEDPEIKKFNLEKFIESILRNEEIMEAYQAGSLAFSELIDDFSKEDIIAALDEAVTNKKMVEFSEAIEYE